MWWPIFTQWEETYVENIQRKTPQTVAHAQDWTLDPVAVMLATAPPCYPWYLMFDQYAK